MPPARSKNERVTRLEIIDNHPACCLVSAKKTYEFRQKPVVTFVPCSFEYFHIFHSNGFPVIAAPFNSIPQHRCGLLSLNPPCLCLASESTSSKYMHQKVRNNCIPHLQPRYANRLQGCLKAWPHLRILRDIDPNPASDPSISFLQNLLNDCETHHVRCRQPSAQLPKRVLDVGNSIDMITLIETQPSILGTYVALSYVWGCNQNLTTTSKSIEKMKSGITIASLPNVFKDVVALTRRLGIRYIWIDALCILQDSDEDWRIESAKMASLYEDAYLTIAASSSTGCDDSFLRYKRDPILTPTSVACTSIGGQQTTVKARLVARTGMHEGTQHVRDPWDMRAWTLQEKLMSTRLVSFSSDEIQWCCKTFSTCECGAALSRDTTRYPRSLSEIEDANNAYEFWQRQVMEYSRRLLTKSRDKLPAISGLARMIHNVTGSGYFAGLWLENLLRDLCWKRDRLRRQWEPPWELPPVDRSPTFSWSSVDGKVYYDFYLLHYDVTFKATVIT